MQWTPESSVYHGSCKGQQYCENSDSGYSGFFHSPQSVSGLNSCSALLDFSDTPKEFFRPSVTPKEKSRELVQLLHKDSSRVKQHSTLSWCETPKVYKRDVPLRHRLPMCNAINDQSKRSPCAAKSSPDRWLGVSFESLDIVPQASNSSTLNLEQDSLSGRKRRLLFSQVRTSTLEDGTHGLGTRNSLERDISLLDDFRDSIRVSDQVNVEAPCLSTSSKENSLPVDNLTSSLYYSSDVLCTPSSTQTPKYIRSLCEDSGFSSLTHDESQDSSVNHDGSFQELLLSTRKGNSGTPNLTDAKRRSRLQRQHRLSTLKEGGSQSEEDPSDRKHQLNQCRRSTSKDDDVFVSATPRRVLSLKYVNTSSGGSVSTRHRSATPLRETTVKLHSEPPISANSVNSDATPLKTTVANLSLTPALQMVHILSQQTAQMFAGQSPSLKEQLRIAATLAQTPVVCKTTMPLAGLIGRKMGLGKVDILTELWKRNLRHILAVILGHLSSEGINRCAHVCKGWDEIIQQDKQARFRTESHRLEIGGFVHVADIENRLTRSKRSALQTIQAQSTTSSYCTPQSGTRTLPLGSGSKWDKFVEVAKTLFNDECLRHCPRCQHPAKCHPVKGEGVCTRDDCSFKFCTACLCAFHGSKECDRQSVGLHKKDVLLPGSAQRKRSIRRL
ncbi:F-box only protein 43 [Dunckerocampus dactyliophorus]|uniref:F-box only protein 43 n=1 Tax=Dunckerocampus dactyliophorus TaxID=161453 RepID=UPI002406CF8E|nr:F-box only protein 43 [Dunckerocampus dactyliophorus]